MLSSIGKSIVVAIALAGVVATTSCSGQTMRERWQQRLAERRAGQGQQGQQGQGPMGGRRYEPVSLPAGALVDRDLAYGSDPAQKMDVYRPANAQNAPVIFMVHGGGWRRGDKEAAGVVNNKVEHWLPKGYIVVSVGYRLVPQVTPMGEAQDIAQALAFAQGKARSWGGDPSRFVLMGHSAGAHLVSLLTSAPSIATNAGAGPWLGTVVLDSAAYNVVDIMQKRHFGLYDEAFGSDQQLWRDASPILRLTKAPVPMLLVCSSQRADSCAQAQAYADKAKSLGGRVSVYPIDMRHGEINAQLGAPGQDLTAQVDNFLHSLNLP
jgi:acetyl esterase/lipase